MTTEILKQPEGEIKAEGDVQPEAENSNEQLLASLGRLFLDFSSGQRADIREALVAISPMLREDQTGISFKDALSAVPLDEMEQHAPNLPQIARGVAEQLRLISCRENDTVGNLSFAEVKSYLEGIRI